MIRSGSPIYSRFTKSFKEKRDKKTIWRFNINNNNVIIIYICCIVCICITLYYYYWYKKNNVLIESNNGMNEFEINENHKNEKELLSFLVIGDWGANPKRQSIANQTYIANAMKLIHDKYSTSFVISVGDHFYEDGIINSNDKRWITGFENIYDKSLTPWYIIFGNHDFRGSIKAQIEYSKLSKNNRWITGPFPPSFYYSKDFLIPNFNQLFRIIFLDTNNLLCNHDQYNQLDELEKYECDEMFYKLPQTFIDRHYRDDNITISMEDTLKIQKYNFQITRDEQLKWFKQQVIDANNDDNIKFVLITGHHALFSQGPHKIPKLFNSHIQKILRLSNKILTWFCGHNHALEHYIWNRQKHNSYNTNDNHHLNELHQILSGSGGREIHKMNSQPVESILDDVKLGYLGKEFGFVSVHLLSQQLKIQFWNEFGEALYSNYIPYPQKLT